MTRATHNDPFQDGDEDRTIVTSAKYAKVCAVARRVAPDIDAVVVTSDDERHPC